MAREYDPPPRTRPTGRWRSDFEVTGEPRPKAEPVVVEDDDDDTTNEVTQ